MPVFDSDPCPPRQHPSCTRAHGLTSRDGFLRREERDKKQRVLSSHTSVSSRKAVFPSTTQKTVSHLPLRRIRCPAVSHPRKSCTDQVKSGT